MYRRASDRRIDAAFTLGETGAEGGPGGAAVGGERFALRDGAEDDEGATLAAFSDGDGGDATQYVVVFAGAHRGAEEAGNPVGPGGAVVIGGEDVATGVGVGGEIAFAGGAEETAVASGVEGDGGDARRLLVAWLRWVSWGGVLPQHLVPSAPQQFSPALSLAMGGGVWGGVVPQLQIKAVDLFL